MASHPSAAAIHRLQDLDLEVVALTGDNRRSAEATARDSGIPRLAARVLPDGKVAAVRRLQEVGGAVGANSDAPALAPADVGIAVTSRSK